MDGRGGNASNAQQLSERTSRLDWACVGETIGMRGAENKVQSRTGRRGQRDDGRVLRAHTLSRPGRAVPVAVLPSVLDRGARELHLEGVAVRPAHDIQARPRELGRARVSTQRLEVLHDLAAARHRRFEEHRVAKPVGEVVQQDFDALVAAVVRRDRRCRVLRTEAFVALPAIRRHRLQTVLVSAVLTEVRPRPGARLLAFRDAKAPAGGATLPDVERRLGAHVLVAGGASEGAISAILAVEPGGPSARHQVCARSAARARRPELSVAGQHLSERHERGQPLQIPFPGRDVQYRRVVALRQRTDGDKGDVGNDLPQPCLLGRCATLLR